MNDSASAQVSAYDRGVAIVMGFSIITAVGGLLWLLAGAGIYGSPVAGASGFWPGEGRNTQFWYLCIVLFGPVGLLPFSLLEAYSPRFGALAMIFASCLILEFGNRASCVYWGFNETAHYVSWFISFPMILVATTLLILRSRKFAGAQILVTAVLLGLLLAATTIRRQRLAKYWDANCPLALEQHRTSATGAARAYP